MSMSSENVVHIKLNHIEALRARRSILSLEMGSIRIAKQIDRYRAIRFEELRIKNGLYGKIKETKSDIKRLKDFLPSPKRPKIIKKDEFREKPGKKESSTYSEMNEGDIKSQLREIERRLGDLQSEDI